ncbi:LuxR family transcriptional regulator [Nocardia sp. NEAU-G5]|uniref:LuxR family transcriptional regulator n=1 Tax=Nocardia albiluteola TaxID=2842303 RepID=A0ABS6AZ26_9NOCA|nr:LuxR family transcriptional regulator [Nocardia albiluteola]MBU3062245.1 LuxR family transcriptional regulator [Nocardia albiluteola]
MLQGRETELSVVTGLIERARNGASGTLVLRGEPGIGKTALLAEAVARADGFRVIRVTGVETEAELTFAGLHLLLRSGLDRLDALPQVQADALGSALGLTASAVPPDRFLIGLAVLSLLSELASEQPLLCVVDDAQWLDKSSADALLFAARRLDSEAIVALFATRTEGDFRADGLAELPLTGLTTSAAVSLLDDCDLPQQVRYRILAEAAGNPLALLELPRAVAADAAGLRGVDADPLPLTERLRRAFEGRLTVLPASARTALLIAAVEGAGDLEVILRAAAGCGASSDDLDAAREAGLVELSGGTLTFRHPLVRAAVHRAAALSARRAAHRAVAAALDGPEVADRRAWHLAAATEGQSEEVAAELERTAARAQERNGAAGVWYARAADLSADPTGRARRLTLAAEAMAQSGEPDQAVELAERALLLLDGTESAFADPAEADTLATRLAHVRATTDFLSGDPASAHRRMTDAAARVAATDPALAATLLIEAIHAAWYTGPDELADAVARLEELPLDPDQRPAALAKLLIRAVSPVIGRPAGEAAETDRALAAAVAAAQDDAADLSPVVIAGVALLLGRDRIAQRLAVDLAARLRRRGLIGSLPGTLFYAATAQLYGGRVTEARQTVAEAVDLASATGQQHWLAQFAEAQAMLAAIEGDETRVADLIATTRAHRSDMAWRAPWAIWAAGLVDLGSGRAESALNRLVELDGGRRGFHIPATRSTPDLMEAAVRVGHTEHAAEGLALLEKWATHTGQPWTAALVHRGRALLSTDDKAEYHFRTALTLSAPEDRPFEHARTQLLFGEWLRRAKRKAEARIHLTAARETFDRLGAVPWARRADNELTATGTSATRSGPADDRAVSPAAAVLTPQELQIVRLAAQGLSNKDIAAQLFLSPRTIGAHLYKAYPKLGILSRTELPQIPLH